MIEVGRTIGNYRITAKLGEGGMGVVYLAEHPVIGKKVAMKVIHPELSRNAEVVSRFQTEAKSVNQIGNDHIVDISDFGSTPDGESYFIMEFLQGESLSDRLKREKLLPPARAIAIAAQVTDALGSSHEVGIIHRDLKPENIYLVGKAGNRDFVKVLDFGLAKLTQGDDKVSHKTRTGSVMGTPYYMAPEQCEGRPNIDHRCDIYSLGIILFEMLTGKVPFGGEGYGEIIVKHITTQPPSPRSINPALPESLEKIVYRALAKAREQRFQTMASFGQALADPEGYARGAPAVTLAPIRGDGATMLGSTPAPVSAGGSGQVNYGSGLTLAPADQQGAVAGPMPSTFRSGVGELVDEVPRRSGKGMWVGIAIAMLAGAGGAFAYFSGSETTAVDPHAAAAPNETPAPTTAAQKPTKVRISFASTPVGATVIRKSDGKEIGKTPITEEIAFGTAAIEFTMRRDGFQDLEFQIVPDKEREVERALVAIVKSSPTVAASPSPSRKPSSSSSSGKRRPPRNQQVDEDAVLEPKF